MARETDILILGAGPSGLAAAASLRKRGADVVLLEQAAQVGSTWRRHYERLHLHTVKQLSALPGMPWPDSVPLYPSRADMVAYLERYAARFELAPRFGEEVTSARYDGLRWAAHTRAGEHRARALVVATGYNRVPRVPSWPGEPRFRGALMHSAHYRTGAPFRGKRALVVGAGNSGAEIALDLWEHGAHVTLSVRSPVHVVPRDLLGVPAQAMSLLLLGRLPPSVSDALLRPLLSLAIGDLSPWGISRPALGPARQVVERGRIPLLDVGTIELIKQGLIRVMPGPRELTERGVVFTDGRELPFDAVILATGYRPGFEDFLENASQYTDDRGYPRWHGAPTPVQGVFFIGFRNPLTGALYDIAREAERIAQLIVRN